MTLYQFILELGFWQWLGVLIAIGLVCDMVIRSVASLRRPR